MAKIVKFEDVKGLYEELVKDLNLEKDHPEKFMGSLVNAYLENKKLLDREDINIKLNKASQWIILTIEPELLEKTLLRARDLGFIAAYQQNPAFLKNDVDKIIKRMAECDANNVKYINEKGKYQNWLFSNRAYAYVTKELIKTKIEDKKEVEESTPSLDYETAKEYTKRVIETFALEENASRIYAHLGDLINKDLDIKSLLMELFKEFAVDNLDYLSTTIDEILSVDEEEKRGRVAA